MLAMGGASDTGAPLSMGGLAPAAGSPTGDDAQPVRREH
jgi:hypothetical protein